MYENGYLVAYRGETREERWQRHWEEAVEIMTERCIKLNAQQPVTERKATEKEIKEWTEMLEKKNPFRLEAK